MAAAIAQRGLEQRGWTHVAVRSAGIAAADGQPASSGSVTVAGELGLDLSAHRAHSIEPGDLQWADLILGMSHSHIAAIAELGGSEKAAMITDFMDGEDAGEPIEDPFGGDDDEYRRTGRQLQHAIEALFGRLEPILAP